jgi:hypothetical protein
MSIRLIMNAWLLRVLLGTLVLSVLSGCAEPIPGQGAGNAVAPNTAAGQQLAAWIVRLEQGDATAISAFLPPTQPEPAAAIAHLRPVLADGLLVRKVEQSAPHDITALVQIASNGAMYRVQLQVDPDNVNHIDAISIEAL